jgi:hypothetical protein
MQPRVALQAAVVSRHGAGLQGGPPVGEPAWKNGCFGLILDPIAAIGFVQH